MKISNLKGEFAVSVDKSDFKFVLESVVKGDQPFVLVVNDMSDDSINYFSNGSDFDVSFCVWNAITNLFEVCEDSEFKRSVALKFIKTCMKEADIGTEDIELFLSV